MKHKGIASMNFVVEILKPYASRSTWSGSAPELPGSKVLGLKLESFAICFFRRRLLCHSATSEERSACRNLASALPSVALVEDILVLK
jgi:hypothetical protein